MSAYKPYLEKYGAVIAIAAFVLLKLFLGEWGIEQIAVTLAALLVLTAIHALAIYVFKFNKSGPIPWYGSPLIWVGIPVVVLIYGGLSGNS